MNIKTRYGNFEFENDNLLNEKIYAITNVCTFAFIDINLYNTLTKDILDSTINLTQYDKSADELLNEKLIYITYTEKNVEEEKSAIEIITKYASLNQTKIAFVWCT